MSQLQLGERVLTLDARGALTYSDVILFFHKDAETKTQYLQLETDSGHRLTITANHLMHSSTTPIQNTQNAATETQITFARNIARGHYILYTDLASQSVKTECVANVTVVRTRGMYAPLTKHGTIVVENYVTSCYAHINSHSIAHACLAPMRLVYDLYSLFFTTPRASHLNSSQQTLFDNSLVLTSHNQNGVHWYADILHSIAYFVIPHSLLYNT